MRHLLLSAAVAATLSFPAHAALGGHIATVESDRIHLQARAESVQQANYTIHQMTAKDGTVVNEYADKTGTVFAVTWTGPWQPNLQQLLGEYFGSYQQESAKVATRPASRRAIHVSKDDLVVEASGHMHAFSGTAYLVSRLPAGVTPAELK